MNIVEREAFVLKMAQVLAETHRRGIIHGDLGIDHFLTYDGHVDIDDDEEVNEDAEAEIHLVPAEAALIDFAFSRKTEEAEEIGDGMHSLASVPEYFGKRRYTTPDRVAGYPLDQQSEVETFAWIACEVLTGELPTRGNIGELLANSGVSKGLRERLVAAAGPRTNRYAHMAEFVENPYGRCADVLVAHVLKNLSGPWRRNVEEYLQDPYLQRKLAEHVMVLEEDDRESKKKKMQALKELIFACPDDESRQVFLGMYNRLFFSGIPELVIDALAVLDVRVSSVREEGMSEEIKQLYRTAQSVLFDSAGRFDEAWRSVQAHYFSHPHRRESSELVFSEQCSSEEAAFFVALLRTAVISDAAAAPVFAANSHVFSSQQLTEIRTHLPQLLHREMKPVSEAFFGILESSSDTLSQVDDEESEAPSPEDVQEVLRKSRVVQEALLAYCQRTQRNPEWQTRWAHEDLFGRIIQSLQSSPWPLDLSVPLLEICRSPLEQEGAALIRYEDSPEATNTPGLSRRERIHAFFSNAGGVQENRVRRLARVPAGTRVDMILEYLETEEDPTANRLKRTSEHGVYRMSTPLQELSRVPESAFSVAHVQRLRQLGFDTPLHLIQEGHHFGQLRPAAFEYEAEVLEVLTRLVLESESAVQEEALEALIDFLKELHHRIGQYYFLDRDTRLKLRSLMSDIRSDFSRTDGCEQLFHALTDCEERLTVMDFCWLALILPALSFALYRKLLS